MLPGFMQGAYPSRQRFVTDFREYPTGATLPVGWTSRGATLTTSVADNAGDPGGRSFSATAHATVYGLYSLDAAGSGVTDGEITAIILSPSVATQAVGLGLAYRANAGITAYEARIQEDAQAEIDFLKAAVAHVSQVAFAWTASTRYAIRARFQGTNHKVRVWAWGTAEPSTWSVDVTETTYASGWVGLILPHTANGTYTVNGRWTWFAFQPGAGTAPLPSG